MSSASETGELLSVAGLTKHFPVTRGVIGRTVGHVRAVDDVSFTIAPGETLGLVGESGSGKTTVGRSILRLIEPTRGRVLFDGNDVLAAEGDELRRLRQRMQIVFQDPYGSLNPRMRVVDLIGEAIEQHGILHGPAVERRVAELLGRVGLSPSWINRYPHEFSGGQRQRIGVARAIALEPKLVICDEPVSALDVSIQAQVVNLLKGLGRDLGLSYLFIAHDLSVVRHISHRIAVMYLGEIVEVADGKRLFSAPAHPYTRALLSAIPIPDPTRQRHRLVLAGDVPSPLNPPSGCRFHTRCPAVFDRCPTEVPQLVEVEPGHPVRCFHAYDVPPGDWYAVVNQRIEDQIRKNARADARPLTWFASDAPPARDAVEEPGERETARKAQRARTLEFGEAPVHVATPFGRALGVLFAVVLVALMLAAFARAHREATARRVVDELGAAIEARAAITGTYPASIGQLGWRLPAVFRGGPERDPWGRHFRYRAPSNENPSFELRSFGADGIESHDDVVLRRPTR